MMGSWYSGILSEGMFLQNKREQELIAVRPSGPAKVDMSLDSGTRKIAACSFSHAN